MRKTSFTLTLILLFLNVQLAQARNSGPASGDIQFIENKGQWPQEVLFRAGIPGGAAFFLKNSIVYTFYDPAQFTHGKKSCIPHVPLRREIAGETAGGAMSVGGRKYLDMHAVAVALKGANPGSTATGRQASATKYNYFTGSDPTHWASGARAYNEIYYADIYAGIDLVFYSKGGALKYDFILDPGAPAEKIVLSYYGVDELFLKNNTLHIATSINTFHENIPLAFQTHDRDTTLVDCRYKLDGVDVSYDISDADPAKTLVVDPVLVFSSYSGSEADNWGSAATHDSKGNLYSGGIAANVGFPVTVGAYQVEYSDSWDIAIQKFDSAGNHVLYATYLGGASVEVVQSLMVDSNDNLLLTGATGSHDFPIKNGYSSIFKGGQPIYFDSLYFGSGTDIFVAKLSEDGSDLLAASFIGGSENDGIKRHSDKLVKNYGDEFRADIFVDHEDAVYVASCTKSADFPVENGFQESYGGGEFDAVVFKLSGDLSQLLWSSFLGGSRSDAAYSVKVNAGGVVYAAGGTDSHDFPVTHGAAFSGDIDGFVFAFDQDKGDATGRFVGTAGYDQAYFVDLDAEGYVYLLGQTAGSYPVGAAEGKPLYMNAQSGQFIHKLTEGLESDNNCFSTVFGSGSGSPDICPTAFMVNDCGKIYVSGWGGNQNDRHNADYVKGHTAGLPVTENAEKTLSDSSDFYLMVLEKDAQELLYGSFFGGDSPYGEHAHGGVSRFDKKGVIYQSVCAGCGGFSDFYTTPGAAFSRNNSDNCNSVAFKMDFASLTADFETSVESGCKPLEVGFTNRSTGGEQFVWDFGPKASDGDIEESFVFENPGVYQVKLTAFDDASCTARDSAVKIITVYDHDFSVGSSDTICFGASYQLHATGGVSYAWHPSESLSDPTVAAPVAAPDSSTSYIVFASTENGCLLSDTVKVHVIPKVVSDFTIEKHYACVGLPSIRFTNQSSGAGSYMWQFGNGDASTDEHPEYQYQRAGKYTVSLTSALSGCSATKSAELTVAESSVPNVFTPNADNVNDSYILTTDANVKLEVFNRWGAKVYESENYKNDWTGEGLGSGVYYVRIEYPEKKECYGWVHLIR